MPLGCCWVDLHIPAATSLKEKRRSVKSVLDRLRNRLNVSASEMESQDLWQRAELAVACVSNSQKVIAQTFEKAVQIIEQNGEVLITRVETEYL